MKRIVLAGLFAGVALFAWESVAHILLPLGETGIKALPNERAVLSTLQDQVREPGFYIFPAPEESPGMTARQKQDAMAKAQERWRTGPAGMMVFHPDGAEALSPRQLLTQFAADIAAMLIAAAVASRLADASFARRAALIALLGLLPTLQVELANWNWYGFPLAYLLAQATVHLVGFAIGGLLLAKLLNRSYSIQPPPSTSSPS
jgi:hypothetical protein